MGKQSTCNHQGGFSLSLLFLSLSEPLLGYYKPDDHGIILESEIGPNRKKV